MTNDKLKTKAFLFIIHHSAFIVSNDFRSGLSHLFNGSLAVAGLEFHGAHGIYEGFDFETFFERVEHCVFDAVVCGKSADQDFLNALLA